MRRPPVPRQSRAFLRESFCDAGPLGLVFETRDGSIAAAQALADMLDSTRHRKVIRNARQLFQGVPIQLGPASEEPPQEPEVSQGDPSSEVVQDRPPILPRGFRFKSGAT